MSNPCLPGSAARRGLAACTILLALAPWSGTLRAQTAPSPPDSLQSDARSPRGALIRSALVPGWGQIYNGQPLKAPIIVGAIGGLVYAVVTLNGQYRLYREAYQYKYFQERVDSGALTENPRMDYQASYDEIAASVGAVSSGPLRSHRDVLRRNRDLSILGVGVVWALSVLDAYVSAHLLDFDVGEDLALRVRPGLNLDGSPVVAPSVVWRPGGH